VISRQLTRAELLMHFQCDERDLPKKVRAAMAEKILIQRNTPASGGRRTVVYHFIAKQLEMSI
jgi:hypothetical protein